MSKNERYLKFIRRGCKLSLKKRIKGKKNPIGNEMLNSFKDNSIGYRPSK